MSYVWRTMEDDRVRPEHAARNGLVFDDNYRPEPGEEYNCRCIREATEEVDDEDQAAPPDPFGTFGKTFATSFGVSVAKEFYNAQLAPKLGLSKSTGGGRIGVLFTGINFFTQAGTPTEKLGSAALSIGTTLGLSKLETMLPGYAKLIIPAFVIGQGLLTGESVGEITGKVAGSILGSKFGGGVGGQIFGNTTVPKTVSIKKEPSYTMSNQALYQNKEFKIAQQEIVNTQAARSVRATGTSGKTPLDEPFKIAGNIKRTAKAFNKQFNKQGKVF
jgi:hypothetical protein